MPKGLSNPKEFAVLDIVNITIWNGIIIEKTKKRYKNFVKRPGILVKYQAVIEVQITIRITDATVIKSEYPKADRKLVSAKPLI